MKAETCVVSSYEISPTYQMELGEAGYLRVGQTEKDSGTKDGKKRFTMDEAIAKLRGVLKEMKDQDKSIYQQLMTLHSNIQRLKGEISCEAAKRQEYDIEYDDESSEDSDSDFDVNEDDKENSRMGQDSTNMTPKQKDEDSDSIHERFDSGILEDAPFNVSNEIRDSPRKQSSSPKPNSVRQNIQQSKSKDGSLRYSVHLEPAINVTVCKREETKPETALFDEEQALLQRSHTMQPRKLAKEKPRKLNLHKRSFSEDRSKLDINSNVVDKDPETDNHPRSAPLTARERYHRRHLGYISESGSPKNWDAFDSRNYGSSERPRTKMPPLNGVISPDKGSPESKQFGELMQQNKQLNNSLTRLNLQGAISNGALQALRRSTSMGLISRDGAHSLDDTNVPMSVPRRHTAGQSSLRSKYNDRLRKTASAYFPGFSEFRKLSTGYDIDFLTNTNAMISSTISLV